MIAELTEPVLAVHVQMLLLMTITGSNIRQPSWGWLSQIVPWIAANQSEGIVFMEHKESRTSRGKWKAGGVFSLLFAQFFVLCWKQSAGMICFWRHLYISSCFELNWFDSQNCSRFTILTDAISWDISCQLPACSTNTTATSLILANSTPTANSAANSMPLPSQTDSANSSAKSTAPRVELPLDSRTWEVQLTKQSRLAESMWLGRPNSTANSSCPCWVNC